MARFEASPFELTEMAAAGGTADALLELGLVSRAGRDDVAVDLIGAHKWFNRAALRGNAEAKRYGMEIARELPKREIAEAQRQARESLARHLGATRAALNRVAQQRKKSDNMHSQVFLLALPIA